MRVQRITGVSLFREELFRALIKGTCFGPIQNSGKVIGRLKHLVRVVTLQEYGDIRFGTEAEKKWAADQPEDKQYGEQKQTCRDPQENPLVRPLHTAPPCLPS